MEERKLKIDLAEHIPYLRHSLKELKLRRKVYKIFFRGKSFEFDGFRPYSAEDDVTSIDWKASIRADKLLERQYKELEDKKILFVIDVGEHMIFGSTEKLKCEYTAEVVLSLAHLILGSNDRLGYILFNDSIKYLAIPRRGMRHFYSFASRLEDPESYGGGSDLKEILEYVASNFDTSLTAVIIFSDFIKSGREVKKALDLVSSKFETLAIMIKDPLDKELPDIPGEYVIEDPESGEQVLVEPRLAKQKYARHARIQEEMMKEIFKSSNVDLLPLMTDKPFVADLTEFIKRRIEYRSYPTA